ncbi:MAG: muconolactone Delta-isomerase family protein [Ferruginibacter sp.]
MENLNEEEFSKYQVTIHFEMDDAFMSLVPAHREYINSLIDTGTIDYYSVSMETQRCWMIVNATNKKAVDDYLRQTPLYKYWTIEIDLLFVYDSQTYRLPALQLN